MTVRSFERLRFRRPSAALLKRLHRLGPRYRGRFAVIDPDSGRYWIARRCLDAVRAATRALPGKIFFTIRIGYREADALHGRLRPL